MSDWLADLRARFRLRAARDFGRLQALRAGDPNSDELRRLIHSTAGAAGTFGFDALGAAAIAIDDCYARAVTPDADAFQRLADEFAAAAGEPADG